ncbi:MAG: hypothetical protein MJE66_18190 [Proteobacteria bacterium]|nr:hypothetical protein [Pseudomonadota bacterium]
MSLGEALDVCRRRGLSWPQIGHALLQARTGPRTLRDLKEFVEQPQCDPELSEALGAIEVAVQTAVRTN